MHCALSTDAFFIDPMVREFPNPVSYTREKWIQYMTSHSHDPLPDDPGYNEHMREMNVLFDQQSINGMIHHDVVAKVYVEDLYNDYDILNSDRFSKVDFIDKGWSEDKKYCVTDTGGTRYLLRVTPIERFETRKVLHKTLQQVSSLGVPTCESIEFGTCKDGVYSIQSWINGEDLESVLPTLTETEQYVLGLKSGELLRKVHSIPAPEDEVDHLPYKKDWELRFNQKADRNIRLYKECPIKPENGDYFIDYIENNRHLLKNRPQCYQHGDYHTGNMMIEKDEEPLEQRLVIIDFDRCDFGDPWEEFNRITFSAKVSPHFATGQLRGYFDGFDPPIEFFKLLAFYISCNSLASIPWAIPFGQKDIDTMIEQTQDVLTWFDNMQNPVPTWYLKDLYIQWTDSVPYRLKEHFDFSFLNKYGKVFKVYDDQDSGNICFGIANGDSKYFVKFAGAPTERACVNTAKAVANLKSTVPIYNDLAHPNLIRLINSEEVGGGFAMVFEWADAECMHPMYPLSHRKFMQMALETRHQVFEDILTFHTHVAKQGYVAIDFYDGSIMYDFNNNRTVICDIDFYAKTPLINNMGRLWGSSRFMSPEEFELGAVIDEITNVYAMGATAFAFFGDEDRRDRRMEDWKLNKKLYDVVKRAVSDERSKRQQSINQFIEEWRTAK